MSCEYFPYPDDAEPAAGGAQQAAETEATAPALYLPAFTPEELAVDPTVSERGEAAIVRDAATFQQWRGHFLEQDIYTGPLPDTTMFVDNVPKNPFSTDFMLVHHLRRRGYGCVLTDTAVNYDTKQPSPYELAFHTSAQDTLPVELVGERIAAADAEPLGMLPLLDAIESASTQESMDYYYLAEAPDVNTSQPRERLRADLAVAGVQDIQHMTAKAFMTSQVLRAVEQSVRPQPDNPAEAASPQALARRHQTQQRNHHLYQVLKEQGVQPFNIDQLYGMASGIIDAVLRQHPDIEPPANPPQRRRLF